MSVHPSGSPRHVSHEPVAMSLSDVFEGLSHADRLALVFTALHDELAATSPPPPPDGGNVSLLHPGSDSERGGGEGEARAARERRREEAQGEGGGEVVAERDRDRQGIESGHGEGDDNSGREREQEGVGGIREGNGASNSPSRRGDAAPTPSHDVSADALDPGAAWPADDGSGEGNPRTDNRRWRPRPQQHRVIRGGVKASYVGSNVEALPVWGALDAIAGSSLLVDCRTPAQWRADEYRPTAQVF